MTRLKLYFTDVNKFNKKIEEADSSTAEVTVDQESSKNGDTEMPVAPDSSTDGADKASSSL